MDKSHDTIFVQIASYRDPDCKNTIRDLFQNAKNPHKVFVGINWQYSDEDDFEPFYKEDSYIKQIKILKYNCKESKGVCWARAKTQELYNNETFTLQIDAHMRFIPNWDSELIKMHDKLVESGFEKPVISHYPPNFSLDGKKDDWQGKMSPYIRDDGIVYFKLSGYTIDEYNEMPLPSASVAGGLIFAKGEIIKEVPYDPYLYFHGEEITLSVRLWTNGWDIFNPTKIIAYHLYQSATDDKGQKMKVRDIKVHKDDNPDHKELEQKSIQRIKYLLGTSAFVDNPEAIENMEKFSLGTHRSLYQYENYSGIDFKNLQRTHFSRMGIFFNDATPKSKTDEISFLENFYSTKYNNKNFFGLDVVLEKFSIKKIIGIKEHTCYQNLKNIDSYIGLDYLNENINFLRYYFRLESNKIFYQINILREPLPFADAIACDSFFEHAPKELGWQLLVNIRKNNIKYMMATYSNSTNKLSEAPYYLHEPIVCVPYKNEYIGLWDVSRAEIYYYPLSSELASKRALLILLLEDKLNTLEKLLLDKKPQYKEMILRTHQNLSSASAREILDSKEIRDVLKNNNNMGIALIEDIFRIRYWSNQQKILEQYPFIDENDKQFVLALVNEFLKIYEKRV